MVKDVVIFHIPHLHLIELFNPNVVIKPFVSQFIQRLVGREILFLREGIQHQRHSVLLMDMPRIPCRQGNHLKWRCTSCRVLSVRLS